MLLPLILLGLTTLAASVTSAAEAIVFALPDRRVRALASGAGLAGRCLASLRERPVSLLATIWMARIAITAAAALAAWNAARVSLGTTTVAAIAAVVTTTVLLVAGELSAKILALRDAERFSLAASVPLWAVARALWIVLRPLEALAGRLTLRLEHALPRITDREIRDLVSPGNGEPVIEEHERRLIQRAFLLDQTQAYDVMTPRVDIFAWADSLTLSQIAPQLRSVRYSRVPLYGESIDDVTGVLYTRDAYQALISGQRDVELRVLAREPFFVPGSVTLDRLLLDFQSRRIHLGLVIDEYGGTDGLITLEDILEELVGEITDETDVAEDHIVRLNRNEVLVDGSADLREINHFFNTTFPLLEHRSLNGYLLDELGRVPEPGEKIARENVLIEVVDSTETQVLRARLSRHTPRAGGIGPGRGGGPGTRAEKPSGVDRTRESPERDRSEAGPAGERPAAGSGPASLPQGSQS